MNKILAAAAGLVLAAGLAAAATVPAGASAAGKLPPGVRVAGHAGAVRFINTARLPHTHLPKNLRTIHRARNETTATTRNWSGYADVACGTCALRFAATSFTVPSINCTGVTTDGVVYAAFWAGLDGFGNSTVEQTGVDAYCDYTTPVYYGWYEMYPEYPVAWIIQNQDGSYFGAGDPVSVSAYHSGPNTYQLVWNDLNDGITITANESCPSGYTCQNKTAEVVAEAPYSGGYLPLADFGQAVYANATVTSRNGTHGNLGDEPLWNSYQIDMFDGSTELASAGPLSNVGVHSSFADTWLASS
jgi:peptidase A4-like protein